MNPEIPTTRGERPSTVPFEEYVDSVRERPTDENDREVEDATGTALTSNEVYLMGTGPEAFLNIEKSITAARRSIKINIFSWAPDSTGMRLAKNLVDAKMLNPSLNIELRVDKLGCLLVGGKGELKDKFTNPLALLKLGSSLTKYPNLSINQLMSLQDDPGKIHDFPETTKKELEAFIDKELTADLLLEINPALRKMKEKGINLVIEDNGLAGMDHSKVFIFDDKTVYSGGMNVGDDYSGGFEAGGGWTGKKKDYWKDYMVRITGPASNINRRLFFGEDKFNPELHFARPTSSQVRVLHNSGGEVPAGTSAEEEAEMKQVTFATMHLIDNAQKEIKIEHAYIMDQEVVDKLKAAAARGVQITIVRSRPENPGLEAYNEKYFSQMAGVGNIDIYKAPQVSHTKLICVDGNNSIVGSANLSRESLHYHEESSFMVSGDNGFQRQIREQLDESIDRARAATEAERAAAKDERVAKNKGRQSRVGS